MSHDKQRMTSGMCALALALLFTLPSSLRAGWLFQTGLDGSLTDVGSGLGGSFDVKLRGYWLPVPELGIGLHASALFPLHIAGQDVEGNKQPDAVLMAGPALILRFGDDSAWGFVRTGLYGAAFITSVGSESALNASLGAGFVVVPRIMPFHFGFELEGALGLGGNTSLRTIGLGGFIGWTL